MPPAEHARIADGVRLLRRIDLFEGLPGDELEEISAAMREIFVSTHCNSVITPTAWATVRPLMASSRRGSRRRSRAQPAEALRQTVAPWKRLKLVELSR